MNRCLTEGRRSFLERYAGIETGEECARWQPVLSAMVDGEATGDQLVELRPHLRNCGSCRATLRALHTTGTPLGALFPPATLALGAADLEHAGGFLTRLYEAVSMTIHERTASTVLRIHSAVETATAHKAAAIAASAVAVAGGGLAVEEARRLPEPARAVAERSTPRGPASVVRPSRAVPRRDARLRPERTHAACPTANERAAGDLAAVARRVAAGQRAARRSRREPDDACPGARRRAPSPCARKAPAGKPCTPHPNSVLGIRVREPLNNKRRETR